MDKPAEEQQNNRQCFTKIHRAPKKCIICFLHTGQKILKKGHTCRYPYNALCHANCRSCQKYKLLRRRNMEANNNQKECQIVYDQSIQEQPQQQQIMRSSPENCKNTIFPMQISMNVASQNYPLAATASSKNYSPPAVANFQNYPPPAASSQNYSSSAAENCSAYHVNVNHNAQFPTNHYRPQCQISNSQLHVPFVTSSEQRRQQCCCQHVLSKEIERNGTNEIEFLKIVKKERIEQHLQTNLRPSANEDNDLEKAEEDVAAQKASPKLEEKIVSAFNAIKSAVTAFELITKECASTSAKGRKLASMVGIIDKGKQGTAGQNLLELQQSQVLSSKSASIPAFLETDEQELMPLDLSIQNL